MNTPEDVRTLKAALKRMSELRNLARADLEKSRQDLEAKALRIQMLETMLTDAINEKEELFKTLSDGNQKIFAYEEELNTLRKQGSGSPELATENAQLKKEIESLNEQINEQFAQLSQNLMETEELKEKLRNSEHCSSGTMDDTLSQMSRDMEAMKSKLVTLQRVETRCAELENQNTLLMQQRQDDELVINELENDMNALQKIQGNLEESLEQATKRNTELAGLEQSLNEEIQELKSERDDLKRKCELEASQDDSVINDLLQKNEQLENDLSTAARNADDMKEQLAKLQEDSNTAVLLRERLDRVVQEKESFANELETIKESFAKLVRIEEQERRVNEQMMEKEQVILNEIEKFRTLSEQTERMVKELKIENSELRDAIMCKENELMDVKSERDALASAATSDQENIKDELQKVFNEKNQLIQRVQQQEKELSQAVYELEEAKRVANEKEKAHSEEVAKLTEEVKIVANEKEKAHSEEIAKLTEEAKRVANEKERAHSEEVAKLTEEVKRVANEKERAHSEEVAKITEDREKLNGLLSQALEELEILKSDKQSVMDNAKEEIARTHKHVSEMTSQLMEARECIERKETELKVMSNEFEELTEKAKLQQDKIDSMSKDLISRTEAITKCEERISDLMKLNEQTSDRETNLTEAIAKLRNDKESLYSSLQELKHTNEANCEKINSLEENVREAQEIIQQHEENSKNMRDRLITMEKEYNLRENELQIKAREYEKLETDLNRCMSSASNKEQELTDRISELTRSLESQSSKFDELAQKLRESEDENDRKEEQLAELGRTIKEAETREEQLKVSVTEAKRLQQKLFDSKDVISQMKKNFLSVISNVRTEINSLRMFAVQQMKSMAGEIITVKNTSLSQCADFEQECREKESELMKSITSLTLSRDAETKSQRETTEQLLQELDAAKMELRVLRDRHESAVQEYQIQISAKSSEYLKKVMSLRDAITDYETQISELRSTAVTVSQICESKDFKIQQLEDALAKQNRDVSEREQRMLSTLKSEYDVLSSTVRDYEVQVRSLQDEKAKTTTNMEYLKKTFMSFTGMNKKDKEKLIPVILRVCGCDSLEIQLCMNKWRESQGFSLF